MIHLGTCRQIAVLDNNLWVGIGLEALLHAAARPASLTVFSRADALLHHMAAQPVATVVVSLPAPWPGTQHILEQLRRGWPGVRIVVLTASHHGAMTDNLVRSLAHAVVSKRDPLAHLLRALDAPLRSSACYRSDSIPPVPGVSSCTFRDLTPGQQGVIEAVMRGESVQQIARRARLSIKTVSSHKRTAMLRLGVSSLAGLLAVLGSARLKNPGACS